MKTYEEFIESNKEALYQTLEELCKIPAPSGKEEKRAEYTKHWLESIGARGVYIDEALNVVYPMDCEGKNGLTVYVAHTDTVFPDLEPMPYVDDGKKIYCPGVGDDTASLVSMLYAIKYLVENKIKAKDGILFVANSCEEGLGNLKGTRKIFEDYKGRIKQFVSFDASGNYINNRCVGSHRYEVEVLTDGGHSFAAFGKKNAIAELCTVVNKIYEIEVPKIGESRTTYNVGIVEGGTSVNTIAQSAKMLCEYRSDNADCIDIMKEKFLAIFESARSDEVKVNVKLVGERPCARGVDESAINEMCAICAEIMTDVYGSKTTFRSGSTDCNIPLSLGIPAVCISAYRGGGAHTREEWIYKDSLPQGLEIAIRVIDKFNV